MEDNVLNTAAKIQDSTTSNSQPTAPLTQVDPTQQAAAVANQKLTTTMTQDQARNLLKVLGIQTA